MFAYARRRLDDDASAEDAVQEALLAAMRATREGGSAERTWLIGILRHKVLDHIRRASRQRAVDPELSDGHPDFARGYWKNRQTVESVERIDGLEAAERREALRRAIDDLPPLMRRVLVLREIDGLDTEMVCQVTGLSSTYVWTLTHRAKGRLRGALEGWADSRRSSRDV
jgi:RNA polymerase sigma-70 factor (ECF subfamily)